MATQAQTQPKKPLVSHGLIAVVVFIVTALLLTIAFPARSNIAGGIYWDARYSEKMETLSYGWPVTVVQIKREYQGSDGINKVQIKPLGVLAVLGLSTLVAYAVYRILRKGIKESVVTARQAPQPLINKIRWTRNFWVASAPFILLAAMVVVAFVPHLPLYFLGLFQWGLWAVFPVAIVSALLVKGWLRVVPLLAIPIAWAGLRWLTYAMDHMWDDWVF